MSSDESTLAPEAAPAEASAPDEASPTEAPPVDAAPAKTPPPTAGPLIALLLWSFLGMVMFSLMMVGIWSLRDRRAPLPAYADVPEFSLIDRDGSTVGLADLAGAPWVADFIFTRCVAVCPRMTQQMRSVVDAFPADTRLGFVSISVDPEYDTPERMAEFADRHGAADHWHFLTGEVEDIDALTVQGFLLPLDRSPPPEAVIGNDPIIHSNRLVLVDGEAKIRGYYDAFDPAQIQRLEADAQRLLDGR